MEKTFAVSILYQKVTPDSTHNKLRLYFTEAKNVDEATGKVLNHDISDDLEGFTISVWQASECPEQEDVKF